MREPPFGTEYTGELITRPSLNNSRPLLAPGGVTAVTVTNPPAQLAVVCTVFAAGVKHGPPNPPAVTVMTVIIGQLAGLPLKPAGGRGAPGGGPGAPSQTV